MTSCRACILGATVFLFIPACRDEKPAAVDSAVREVPVPAAEVPAAVNSGWNDTTAGPFMLLSLPDNSAAAAVVLPSMTDSALSEASDFELDSLRSVTVELFNRGGLAGSAQLLVDPRQGIPQGCISWPRGRLSEVPSRPWRIGFVRGVVVPLQLDSLEGMKSADSASIVRELARLSSAAAEGDDPAFRGLPFSVRRAFTFSLPGISVIVGEVVRKINEEANPREEHILLIAERSSAGSDGYSHVFDSRVAGPEDAVRTSEILGAVRFVKGNKAAIIVAFDFDDGGRVALVQRSSSREWRLTWRSAFASC